MMIMMVSSIILGPFGHYFVPLMIGSRRMAFPRLEALSFWLLPLAGVVLMTTIVYGGFPTGWTGYPTLGDQADAGMDGYLFAFALVGIGMILNALNMMVTVFNHRAPGMTWSRLPIFVWSMLTTSVLMLLGPPMLLAAVLMQVLDRTVGDDVLLGARPAAARSCGRTCSGSSATPRCTSSPCPGFGIVLEILPVFARKPLWGQRLAVAGMLGVTLLSFMVWQHHLFVSGINASLRPFYMFTTELISVPTGFIFLVGHGDAVAGQDPLRGADAVRARVLLQLPDRRPLRRLPLRRPERRHLHGSFFVMAHFHYTIMGGLVFAFFAGLYYWLPKMTGVELNETLGKIHFWTTFMFFNSTFLPLFAVGMLGMPRRVGHLRPAPPVPERLGVDLGLPARRVDAGVPGQLRLLAPDRPRSRRRPTRGWRGRSSGSCRRRCPRGTSTGRCGSWPGPYEYGDPSALPVMEMGDPVIAAGD